MVKALPILFEDNHLLVVDKPADWVVQGASGSQRSLLEEARDYLRIKYQKPGNVYLGVVSRLDAPVTGVVPFARTSKAAARLSDQFRLRSARKTYLAIVEGIPDPSSGCLEHDLVRPDDAAVTRVAAGHPQAQRGVLRYRLLDSEGNLGLLEVELVTGRKHQIRCQLAAIGCPILGDRAYGAHRAFPHGIALHCRRLVLEHPTLRTPVDCSAGVPKYWPAWTRRCQASE